MLKGALQRTGSIYRRLWQPLQIGPYMLVLILPTPEGWKAEWTLAGKKVTHQPSTRPGIEPGTSGLGGRDLNHCANPSAIGQKRNSDTESLQNSMLQRRIRRLDLLWAWVSCAHSKENSLYLASYLATILSQNYFYRFILPRLTIFN